jgi:hypothetical protein
MPKNDDDDDDVVDCRNQKLIQNQQARDVAGGKMGRI